MAKKRYLHGQDIDFSSKILCEFNKKEKNAIHFLNSLILLLISGRKESKICLFQLSILNLRFNPLSIIQRDPFRSQLNTRVPNDFQR